MEGGPKVTKWEQRKEGTNKITVMILQMGLRWYFYLDSSVVVVGSDEHVPVFHQLVERVTARTTVSVQMSNGGKGGEGGPDYSGIHLDPSSDACNVDALASAVGIQELYDLTLGIIHVRVLITGSLVLMGVRGLTAAECYPLHGLTASTSTTGLCNTQSRNERVRGISLPARGSTPM
jgi:hypothetical protein